MNNHLDASALLAYIKQEKGAKKVAHLFKDAEKKGYALCMHQCNYMEVVYRCLALFGPTETKQVMQQLASPLLSIASYMDYDLANYSAYLKANYHLSLADAIGLAFTKIIETTFWTADQALQPIAQKEAIKIGLIR